MKVTMVIPSYWGRKKEEGRKQSDSIYDHPTPLDEEGTLGRLLDSISLLKDAEGNVTGTVGITRDITGRKQAEKNK